MQGYHNSLIALPTHKRLQRSVCDLVGPYALVQGNEAATLRQQLNLHEADARSFLYQKQGSIYTEIWACPNASPGALSVITLVYQG